MVLYVNLAIPNSAGIALQKFFSLLVESRPLHFLSVDTILSLSKLLVTLLLVDINTKDSPCRFPESLPETATPSLDKSTRFTYYSTTFSKRLYT
jgi:hypothetical protein